MIKEARKPPPPPSSLPLPFSQGINIKNTPSAPKSSEGVKPRSHLLKTGEDIRQKSRGISSRLGNEERERLLKKGRQLFEHARSRRGISSSTRTPSSDPRSKYSTRAGSEVSAPINLEDKLAPSPTPAKNKNSPKLTSNGNLEVPSHQSKTDSKNDTAGNLTQKIMITSKSIPVPDQDSENGWDFDESGDVDDDALDASDGWDFDEF